MFLSFSKTLAKFGGFRLGMGIRINKSNAWFMWIVLLFVYVFQMCWYMFVLVFWLMYAVLYGMYWCIKKLIEIIKNSANNKSE